MITQPVDEHLDSVENWIEHGVALGTKAEQERIIKLLTKKVCEKDCPNHPGECYPDIAGLDRYIELIKGENK